MDGNEPQVRCDGQWAGCEQEATMIGNKGYAYCPPCGVSRRQSGYERVRKLKPAELRQIRAGQPLEAY